MKFDCTLGNAEHGSAERAESERSAPTHPAMA